MSFSEVFACWSGSATFCLAFGEALCRSSFDAFFWELPPLTTAYLSRPFVCVLVQSRSLLQIKAQAKPFSPYFDVQRSQQVVSFANLGKDARLVVPTPSKEGCDYAHLASFLRTSGAEQQWQLWSKLSKEIAECLSLKPLWISTSGLGVHWLHIRLDKRPKYYTYAPYRHF